MIISSGRNFLFQAGILLQLCNLIVHIMKTTIKVSFAFFCIRRRKWKWSLVGNEKGEKAFKWHFYEWIRKVIKIFYERTFTNVFSSIVQNDCVNLTLNIGTTSSLYILISIDKLVIIDNNVDRFDVFVAKKWIPQSIY